MFHFSDITNYESFGEASFCKSRFSFYEGEALRSMSFTCRHFMSEDFSKKTIWRIIKRCEKRGSSRNEKPSGRSVSRAAKIAEKKILRMYKENPSFSV